LYFWITGIEATMETLIIRTQNKKNSKLLKELAIQLGESVQSVTPEQAEDLAFGEMMQEAKTGTLSSREAIMSALNIERDDT
jgi:hypothetical protein